MVECIKRQEERRNGEVQHRCLNNEAEQFRQIVTMPECEGCPVRKFRPPTGSPCSQKQEHHVFSLPILDGPAIVDMAGFSPCPFRYKGLTGPHCSITSLPVTPEICNRCDEETREHTAGTVDKIANYFGAIRRWVAAGRPTRTPEEVRQLFEDHCKGCERYDQKKHACKTCGCAVAGEGDPLDNKLAMASEHCPLGRF